MRDDVDVVARVLEDARQGVVPPVERPPQPAEVLALLRVPVHLAQVGQLRTEHGAVGARGVYGVVAGLQDQLHVLVPRPAEEVVQVGLVPHAPVLDRAAVSLDHRGDEVGPAVRVGRHGVEAVLQVVLGPVVARRSHRPGRCVGHGHEHPQPQLVRPRHEAVGDAPVELALGGLHLEPVHVESNPADPGIGHELQGLVGRLVGVDAVGVVVVLGARRSRDDTAGQENHEGASSRDGTCHGFNLGVSWPGRHRERRLAVSCPVGPGADTGSRARCSVPSSASAWCA